MIQRALENENVKVVLFVLLFCTIKLTVYLIGTFPKQDKIVESPHAFSTFRVHSNPPTFGKSPFPWSFLMIVLMIVFT